MICPMMSRYVTVRNFSRQAAMSFENLVAKYYCQQFFNYFGWAAQIPHHLFAMKDNVYFLSAPFFKFIQVFPNRTFLRLTTPS